MRLLMKIFIMVLMTALTGCANTPPLIDADYVFDNVNIVPMNQETVLPSKTLVVKDNKIIAILDYPLTTQIDTTIRIDGKGQFLLPGLADMHVHVRWVPQAMFNLWLANGVTTVTNMRLEDGEGAIDHLKLRADVDASRMIGSVRTISARKNEK